MPANILPPSDLRRTIEPATLGFTDTRTLVGNALPWIGQERAETAARFGLAMDSPDYNLFVLGEVGSGRSSLLTQVMRQVAATRPVPPDLCYVNNFQTPEKPLALRLPTGQGRLLRQRMAQWCKTLQQDIPQRLSREDFKAESERIERAYKVEEDKAYRALDAFAEARSFSLMREAGRLVFTLRDDQGKAYTEQEALALPRERRTEIDDAEHALRAEITRFLEQMRPMEQVMHNALTALRQQLIAPMLAREVQDICAALHPGAPDSTALQAYLQSVSDDVLDKLALFQMGDLEDEPDRVEALADVLATYRINVAVDNAQCSGAPVVIENNPLYRVLFGSIEYQAEGDMLVTDFSRIRAGSLLRAHGGYLMLHLQDLLTDELVWSKLRRFLRNRRLQIEEAAMALSPLAAVSLEPEAVDVAVKIVLIGSSDDYYDLQEFDPEVARRFRVKVDFAGSFRATAQSCNGAAIFVAHTCERLGLPHFSAAAVARLMEASHREVDDQSRQSALFALTETRVLESAATCTARGAAQVDACDVDAALQAHGQRHNYLMQQLQESIAEGERLITVRGARTGQVNALTQVDLGDYRFGFPVRVTARSFAGEDGVISVEREVEMSGPVHNKGVLILKACLATLFSHLAPLALDASIVFEQEYQSVDGDSASCAELFALLSCLANLPITQSIAVTGAINQHGDVLPVGGINEKIEGYFQVCEAAGLDGSQGVLIPERNRRHLMLDDRVLEAVRSERFRVYTAQHLTDALDLLMGAPAGLPNAHGAYPEGSVLGRAQATLLGYRRACDTLEHHTPPRKRVR